MTFTLRDVKVAVETVISAAAVGANKCLKCHGTSHEGSSPFWRSLIFPGALPPHFQKGGLSLEKKYSLGALAVLAKKAGRGCDLVF
jgi:hypothetical protein